MRLNHCPLALSALLAVQLCAVRGATQPQPPPPADGAPEVADDPETDPPATTPPAAEPPPEVQPPRLLQAVEAAYPESEPPREVSVLLELQIDAAGSVTEASVVQSGGEAFDAAALAAVRSFVFDPARRGDQPIGVRIRYAYDFKPPKPASEPPPLASKLPERSEARTPVAAPKDSAQTPASDEAPLAGAAPFDDSELEFGATAEVEAPPSEPTRHTVKKEQLTRIPGTRGDALRAVEILPGVGRGQSDGPPILRGSPPHESVVLLDGAPVPLIYHFGGLTSFFNSHLLSEVDLYPSNFSSQFGRASGGMVHAKVKWERPERLRAMLELSLIDSFALAEAPVADSTHVAAAVRRSNIDFVFDQIIPEDTFDVVAAPVYYDWQALVGHQFNANHELRVLGYGSRDKLRLVFSNPLEEDPALRDAVEGRLEFHRLQVHLSSRFSPVIEQELMVSAGPQTLEQKIGDVDGLLDGFDLYGRAKWSVFAHKTLRIDSGLDVAANYVDGFYDGPPPPQMEGDPTLYEGLSGEGRSQIDDQLWVFRPAAFLELSYSPVEPLVLIPGVRVDYAEDADAWTADPRFAARYGITETTTLKGGVGQYSQAPIYYELLPGLGNPELDPQRTLQGSAGVEQEVAGLGTFGAEGFYKHYYDRVVATPGGAPPRFVNDGIGRAYGAEFSAELRPTKRTFGYIAYTLSRSERKDRDDDWRLFDHDQTHNLSLTASQELGRGWTLGSRFRLVSGNPTTPIAGAVYDATNDIYRPLYGALYSEREAAFHQLDVRVEKRWDFDVAALTAYLELMNAYNAQNMEGKRYSFDYERSEGVTGMPIFPNLGLRGEL